MSSGETSPFSLSYVQEEAGNDEVTIWTPRHSRSYQERLQKEIDVKDGEVNRSLNQFTQLGTQKPCNDPTFLLSSLPRLWPFLIFFDL